MRVLAVTNIDRVRDKLAKILSNGAYQIVFASNGNEALDRLDSETFDRLILDASLSCLPDGAFQAIEKKVGARLILMLVPNGMAVVGGFLTALAEGRRLRSWLYEPFTDADLRQALGDSEPE